MQRAGHEGTTAFKRWSASVFYGIIRRLSGLPIVPGAADFRLVRRKVVQALRQMPERHRFLRGMIAWAGFRTTVLPYELGIRLGGKPKYTLKKMWRLAFEAIFSFSLLPLWFNVLTGLCLFLAGFLLALWGSREAALWTPTAISLVAWTSTPAIVLIGGVILLGLSLVSAYIGYIFQEVKHRPVYIIRSIITSSEALRERVHLTS